MRSVWIFSVFSLTTLMFGIAFSGADPSFPKPRRNAMVPPAPSMAGANDMDNFEGMDDEFGPPPSMPQGAGPSQKFNETLGPDEYGPPPAAAPKRSMPSMPSMPPQEFDDDLGEDEFGPPPSMPPRSQLMQPRPSQRQGFQQSSGMKAPQRLMPPVDVMDDRMDEDFSQSPAGPPPSEAAQLPPRNYPPKTPELQLGQTGWNQIDVHSLVEGRS